jgi:hypothetical protein
MSNSNPQKDKIGLREIAAAAGVSISTASPPDSFESAPQKQCRLKRLKLN